MTEDSSAVRLGTPTTPHDALFRALLTNPERAGAVLRDHLPEPIAERLDANPPRLIDGSFVDEALRGSQADRLFEARLTGGTPLLIYALLEHKSRPDPKTPLQIAGYMINIWRRYADDHPDRLNRLPAILPLVFYHGTRTWRVPLSLFDMVADDEDLRPFTRSMAYILRDLGKMAPRQLASSPETRAVFQALHISRRGEVGADLLANLLTRLVDGSDLEVAVLNYIVRVMNTRPAALETALRRAKPERWETLMGTIAETWMEQGEARGKAVGIAEGEARGKAVGIAEGEARGKAETFLRLARLKFGDLPEHRVEAVRTASPAQLDNWLEPLLTAENLEDVFGVSLSD